MNIRFSGLYLLILIFILNPTTSLAEDMSFKKLSDMPRFQKSMLKDALESGKLAEQIQEAQKTLPSERKIDLDGIRYADREDITFFIQLLILDMCPSCSTTTSGSTVKVKYGTDSNSGKNAVAVDHSDNSDANKVKHYCDDLLGRYSYERSGKDILIIEDNNKNEKIALCFNRD